MSANPRNFLWLEERLGEPFTDECVEWPFGRDKAGYGILGLNYKSLRVSRLVLEFVDGKSDLFALHSCDNPPCFNPNHLRWGTQQENVEDMYTRERYSVSFGENHVNSKLTEIDIRTIFSLKSLGHRSDDISGMFKVNRRTIDKIVSGGSWKHLNLVKEEL